MAEIVRLCSRNEGKLRELRAALPEWTIELLDADEFPPEEGETYDENALAKARFGRTIGPDDAWMLGEDSGLEAAGLDGRPGLESARFGGDDPVGALLLALRGVDDRRARYVCELVALTPAGEEYLGTGTLEGRIVDEPPTLIEPERRTSCSRPSRRVRHPRPRRRGAAAPSTSSALRRRRCRSP